jgi:hypothetical protein
MKNLAYKILACGLFAAAIAQTARADFLVLSNDFNNSSNNLAVNNTGVGSGFTAFSLNNGVNQFAVDAYETNGKAILASSVIGALSASLDSIDSMNINGGGTVFELSGVQFSTNTPIANTGVGNNDRLMFGVGDRAPAGNWLAAGPPAAIPTGFWIQPMSDSLVTGTGAGGWSGTSTLFYKNRAGTVTQLASWTFDTLKWSPAGPNNFTPTLDIKLTLSGTGWALNITGDTAGGLPISFSGTYAAASINNELADGITKSYFGGFIQCERPGIAMSIDKAIVAQVGSLSVTTPTISAPWELQNTNVVLAGEPVTLTSIVTATGSPTFQWQLEDSSAPGTFTNLPNGTATNVIFDTTGLGDSVSRGVRLVATQSPTTVISPVVHITVIPAVAPSVVRDIDPTSTSLYGGLGVTYSASFYGNQPIDYRWRYSADGTTYSYIPGATNTTYAIASINNGNNGFYLLEASNSIGVASSSASQLTVVPGTAAYHWSNGIPFAGLTSDQILANFPVSYKLAGALVAKNAGNPILVTNTSGSVIAFAGSGSWATVSGGTGFATGANTNQTGNANFNTCLDTFTYDNTTHTITLSGLVVGQQYQLQLFGLDDRAGNGTRRQSYMDPNDSQDTSATSRMGDNSYTLGTFTASGIVQTFQQNLSDTLGNFNCMVLRTVGWNPPPYFTVEPPASAGFFSGNSATFHGAAAGDSSLGAVTYQWKSGPQGGPYTALPEGSKYVGTTTTDLTINNLVAGDSSPVYVLTASNTGGSQNSREVAITIQSTPPLAGYGQYAQSQGPVALWMLNDSANPSTGAAQALDSSGNGHTGTYGTTAQNGANGVVGPQPPTYPGFADDETALQTTANDGNSIVTLPALNDTNLETTAALWIYPKDNGNFAKGFIGGRNNTGVGQIWQFGYSGGNGTLGYNWNDVGGTYNYNSGLAPVLNTWNFVALVIETNQATFYLYYIDPNTGLPVLKSAVNPVANVTPVTMASGTTVIGSDPYLIGGRTFNGSMAGVALFNKALNITNIQTLFGSGFGQTNGFAPTFATQPPSNVVNVVGHTVQISALPSGSPIITNQWQFNGTNIANGGQFSGATSNVLTITGLTTNNSGIYTLTITNGLGGTVSSNANLSVLAPVAPPAGTLVGRWVSGAGNLADQSGFSPAGRHDGYGVTGAGVPTNNYVFTNDVPVGYAGGQSLRFGGNTAIAITNSSTLDSAYVNTFDDGIGASFTVALWAKGFPGTWNPWVSKYGETGAPAGGWQLRRNGGSAAATFTARGTGASADDPTGSISSNDGQWHYYVGTFDSVSNLRRLYVDGNLSFSITGTTPYTLSPATHLTIGGRDQPAGNNFTGYENNGGLVYDVRIYNTALSIAQVAFIQQGPVPTLTSSYTGGKFVLNWSSGKLLESTNVLGPWTTNINTSPYTNSSLTDPAHFYRVLAP